MGDKYQYTRGLRIAFYEGMVKTAKSKGMTLSEYAASLWDEDWKTAAALLVKLMPKEVEVQGKLEHNHQVHHLGLTQTQAFLDSIIESEAIHEPANDGLPLPADSLEETAGG